MRRGLCFLGVAVALLAPGAAGMHGAVACTFNSSTRVASITMSGDGDSVVLKRIGAQIGVNGVPCGAAAVGTTARIAIAGTTRHQQLTLDLSRGAFTPAWSAKAGSGRASSIKLVGGLYPDTPVTIIVGSPGSDNIVAGTNGIQLDGDATVDFTLGAAG